MELPLTENQLNVIVKVIDERDRQDQIWGKQSHSDFKWTTILAEELGEAAKDTFDGSRLQQLQEEVIQCAAVAVAWAEDLEERINRNEP